MLQDGRSYDSYFGQLHFQGQPASSVEPTTGNPDPTNPLNTIQPFLTTQKCTVADLNHSWNGTHQEWNGGAMNGFTAANVDPADPTGSRTMGYFDNSTLGFYYGIANEFSIADHYFASALTQTFPNRMYLLAGTSFGHIRNDIGSYNQKTVFQLLDQATPKVSWKIYLASFQVEELFTYVQKHSSHIAKMPQYYKDAAAGKLPQVAFVESDPFGDVNHESDEHPPPTQVGEVHARCQQALIKSPNWSSSAMFLTYDEHGGYYDHVAPLRPKPDNIAADAAGRATPGALDRYGIRAPRLVRFARMRTLRTPKYRTGPDLGLPNLTNRDKAANPMLGMFDFTKVSNPKPTLLAAPVNSAGAAACIAAHPSAVQPSAGNL